MNNEALKSLIEEKRATDFMFLKAESKVKKLMNILIGMKLLDLCGCLYLTGFRISYFLNAGTFILFAFIIKNGFKLPAYLWVIGCVLNVPVLIESLSYFGGSLIMNLVLILEAALIILQIMGTTFLLFNPASKYFFDQHLYIRVGRVK